jgi:hypothetical protein
MKEAQIQVVEDLVEIVMLSFRSFNAWLPWHCCWCICDNA